MTLSVEIFAPSEMLRKVDL